MDLRVVSFGVEQDLTNKVNGALLFECMPFFLPFYHQGAVDHLCGSCDVE
jgi:hypothetical protein